MFLTKDILNVYLKKKFNKFIRSFEVKNIIKNQMYCFSFLKK